MADHRTRFERWRRLAPAPTKHLIAQVLERIVPGFEAEGLVWQPDYAGGDPNEIGANTIPLQSRSGGLWPTVELRFPGSRRPFFSIDFAALPEECRRLGRDPVPRERAIVVYAPVYFMLCKGRHRNLDGQFGYRWLSPWPTRKLDREVTTALELLPEIFKVFHAGIPPEWLTHELGYVSPHVRLMGSWHLFNRRRQRRRGGASA